MAEAGNHLANVPLHFGPPRLARGRSFSTTPAIPLCWITGLVFPLSIRGTHLIDAYETLSMATDDVKLFLERKLYHVTCLRRSATSTPHVVQSS